MKALRKLAILFAAMSLIFAGGCQPGDIDTIGDKLSGKGATVNEWAYNLMKDAYFWYDEMPDRQSLDSSASPEVYFENLVYQRQVYDRFSLITDDIDAMQQAFSGVVEAYGINYVPAYIDEAKSAVALFVSHVIKGSPADKGGLKRGDIVLKIDNTTLTENNYSTFLSSKPSVTITLGKIVNNSLQADPATVRLTRAQIVEDPVAFSSIIKKQGKTIGYLVYTQFVPGTNADEKKYDNALRKTFGEFKAAGVNELVLDLRLNGGGYMTSAVTLGSLIVSNNSASKVFYKEQWNDKYIEYWKKEKGADALTYKFAQEGNNIGNQLNRIFVLTSKGTASASELIINGLNPYMEVVTIGDNTAGKNLFGSLIGDEEKRWKHGIYMMLGQTTNANNESDYGTKDGISPVLRVADNRFPFLPFGDENEILLNAALVEMGVSTGVNARVGRAKELTGFGVAPLKDTPSALDGKMLREIR